MLQEDHSQEMMFENEELCKEIILKKWISFDKEKKKILTAAIWG